MNKYLQIKIKAQKNSSKANEIIASKSYKRVVGLLVGLGFLVTSTHKAMPSIKISVQEAIAIGQTVEPRILEVLPAAILSFPRSFLHLEQASQTFHEILNALKRGEKGPDFEGISFEKFYEAANRPIKNRKRKIISELRIPKTFRLSPRTITNISKRADMLGLNATAYIEQLIQNDTSAT